MTRDRQPNGDTVSFGYDAAGHRTSVGAGGSEATYDYDAAGRMTIVSTGGSSGGWGDQPWDVGVWGGGSGGPSDGWGKQPWGTSPWGGGSGAGSATYYAYDAAGRMTMIDHRLPNGAPVAYFGYDWDEASRITKVRREGGATIYYSYDDADRLTGERWYN
jgi:YD repeat-containing protein